MNARTDDHGAFEEWNGTRRQAAQTVGAGYHRAAFPADETAGKRSILIDKKSSMDRIADLAEERRALDYEVEATIGAALVAGASWADIGAALGMPRQNAQRKYAHARITYMSQPEEERARLDRAAGVGARRIMFEVRGTDPELDDAAAVTRHQTAAKAWEVAARSRLTNVEVWKVYPQGRAVRMPAQ